MYVCVLIFCVLYLYGLHVPLILGLIKIWFDLILISINMFTFGKSISQILYNDRPLQTQARCQDLTFLSGHDVWFLLLFDVA